MVLHDISMWFSSKEPVLDKTISRINRCNGDKLASLEEALRNDNSLYQSGYFWCVDHILFFWVTTSSNLANMTDPSVMSLSVVQFLKHTQLTEWWMREDRPLLRKIQIFVWYDQWQGGGGLASIVQTFHCDFNELVERLLFCNSELNCGNSPNWFITQRLEYQKQNGS